MLDFAKALIRKERAQSMVEFALTLPVLLLLISGVIDFGRVLFTKMHMSFLSQEAVRLGGLGGSDTEMTDYYKNHFLGDSARLQFVITPADTNRHSGDYLELSVNYTMPYMTPMMNDLVPALSRIQAYSTIRVE